MQQQHAISQHQSIPWVQLVLQEQMAISHPFQVQPGVYESSVTFNRVLLLFIPVGKIGHKHSNNSHIYPVGSCTHAIIGQVLIKHDKYKLILGPKTQLFIPEVVMIYLFSKLLCPGMVIPSEPVCTAMLGWYMVFAWSFFVLSVIIAFFIIQNCNHSMMNWLMANKNHSQNLLKLLAPQLSSLRQVSLHLSTWNEMKPSWECIISLMCKIHLVTCIMLHYTKIPANLELPAIM